MVTVKSVDRDQAVVLLGLAALFALSAYYATHLEHQMSAGYSITCVSRSEPWSPRGIAVSVGMWVSMMVAMMLPVSSPMAMIFAASARRRANTGSVNASTIALMFGYLLVWSAFSVVAALGQLVLQSFGMLTAQLELTSAIVSGLVLMSAGVYQVTPLKHACLKRCQSPFGFYLAEWRDGLRGAFSMGVKHGIFCVGCCWILMLLLFVAGAMNLVWSAVIAVFVLVERLVPGRVVSRVSGVALVFWGAGVVMQSWQ